MSQIHSIKPVTGGKDDVLNAAAVAAIQPDYTVPQGTSLNVSGTLTGTYYLINNEESENGTQIVLQGSTVFEGGSIVMGGSVSNQNFIDGQNNGYVLSNLDDTIMGAGHIGQGGLGTGILTLINYAHGVIDAAYSVAVGQLTITTGSNAVLNYGVLEGTGAAGLLLNSSVRNLSGGKIIAYNGSQVDLNGDTVTGGVLTTVGTGAIDAIGGATLVNVDNEGTLSVQDGDAFYLSGTLVNSGNVAMAGSNHGGNLFVASTYLYLSGAGTVTMGGASPWNNVISGTASGDTLVNVNNTITGAGYIGNNNLVLVNDAAGVIDGSDPSTALTLQDGTGGVTNKGMIEGTGAGGLTINGTTVRNTGGTILAADGSQVDIIGGANVTGGTVTSTGSGYVFLGNSGGASSGSFTNVNNKANVELEDGSSLYLGGSTLVNSGDIALSGGGHTANILVSSPTLYLSGAGTISLNGPTSWNDYISANASGDKLVNVNNTITGGGVIGDGGLVFVNDVGGVVDGSDTSTTSASLTFQNGAGVINQGKIEGTSASGVTFNSTTVNNAGGTILAATGSQIALNGATLDGGTLTSVGTGVVNVSSATFSYLTNNADVSLVDGSALYLSGALVNSGLITVAGGGHGGNIFQSSSKLTLSGGGTVTLGGTTPWANDIGGTASGDTLTNVNNTIDGGGNINLALVNDAKGVIDGSSAYATLTLNNGTGNVTNAGLIEATSAAGLTILNTTVQNTGAGAVLAATGATVTLSGADIVGGYLQSKGTGQVVVSGGNSVSNLTLGANISVLDGDNFYLSGAVKNNGVITVQGGGHGGGLAISGAVTLSGTGSVAMGGTGPWNTALYANGTGAVLTNDSTIVGEGHISAVLVNGATGVIDGKGPGVSYGLWLDNTNTAISNAGLMESTTSGSLIVNDAVNNTSTGQIEAKSGAVDINATVSNAGLIAVNGTATITIASGVGVTDTGAGRIVAFGGTVVVNGSVTGGGLDVDGGVVDLTQSGVSNNVTFLGGGQLELNQSQSYTGQVSGFSKTGANSLDLTDIGFVSANEATFVENAAGTSGVLTVVGSATASITLIGNYSSQTFTTSKDTNGDTIVTASTPQSPSAVHAFAGAMAAFGADHGGSVSTAVQSPRTDHPLLAVSGRAA